MVCTRRHDILEEREEMKRLYAYRREYCQAPDLMDKDPCRQEEYIRRSCKETNLHLDSASVDSFRYPPNQPRAGLIELFAALKPSDIEKVIAYREL